MPVPVGGSHPVNNIRLILLLPIHSYVTKLVYRPVATLFLSPSMQIAHSSLVDLKLYVLTTKPFRLNNASLSNPEPLLSLTRTTTDKLPTSHQMRSSLKLLHTSPTGRTMLLSRPMRLGTPVGVAAAARSSSA